MKSAPAAALAGAALSLLVACGARSTLDAAGGPALDSDAGLPPDAGLPIDGCAPPLAVPTGLAWIGPFFVDAAGNPEPKPCEGWWYPDFSAKRFTVPRFFLDPDEVTNECYAHCVDEGVCEPPVEIADDPPPPSWDDESLRRFAVVADRQRAEAFCVYRGGRLPSVAELARASHGDAAIMCAPHLYWAWVDCYFARFESAACERLLERALGYSDSHDRPFEPVRSEPRDVGPLGHYDLFGSQIERTITGAWNSDADLVAYCALPDRAIAPQSLSEPPGPVYFAFAPASQLYYVLPAAISSSDWGLGNAPFDLPDSSVYAKGFRCAYDPAQQHALRLGAPGLAFRYSQARSAASYGPMSSTASRTEGFASSLRSKVTSFVS